jgi:arylsulfatase A-like enzyme
LTATFLAAAGALPADGKLDGIDLLPILSGNAQPRERAFFWRIQRSDRQQKAVRQGKWKYLKDASTEFLFDLDADIGERRNLAYQHPELVTRLRQLHAAWEADVDRHSVEIVVK